MELGLEGRVAVVTGGASNIGRAIVFSLVAEGARVVIFDIDLKQAERVREEAGSDRVLALGTDVTDPNSVEASVAAALNAFGALHILVNAAGWTYDRLFLDKPYEEWQKEVAINLWGTINVTRLVLPHLVEQAYGRVVNLGSEAGRVGQYQEAVYSATKAGVAALAKSLSLEVGKHGVTFNTVCPGLTVPSDESELASTSLWRGQMGNFSPEVQAKAARRYPLRRLGTARDVANLVTFLASDAAGYLTGQTVSVSGGYTMA
jgi:NAD(P)-dependent dehydrogenase (short-subunit alcohol dehydrogenase family)